MSTNIRQFNLIPSTATFEGIMDLANGETGILSKDIAILGAHCVAWSLLYGFRRETVALH